MDRMNVMDASFLYSEDGRSHNDVCLILVFEGPYINRVDMEQAFANRIALVPRFRQRVKHMPFALALPVWMDDPTFEMSRHVKHHPAPSCEDPLGLAVSRVMSTPMDLSMPLWQAHVVTGLPGDQWALLVRIHHAIVDGVNSTEIVRLLLSESPDGDPPVMDSWRARPEIPEAALLASIVDDAAKDAMNMWNSLAKGPAAMPSLPQTFDPSPLMRPGIPVDPTAINGPVHPGRHWGMLPVPLDRFKDLRSRYQATVNDLLLTACGYGFSSVMEEHLNTTVQDRTIRVMVPMSLRSADASGVSGGNEIGGMVVEIPLGDMSARKRLARIQEQTEAFKELKRSVPADSINPGSSLASPMTLIMASRAASNSPAFVNTVISNVPGPQTPLYLNGRKMLHFGACIPLWTPLKTAVVVMSYNGEAAIGVVTDEATFPTVTPLLDAIEKGIQDLEEHADDATS